MSIVTAWTVVAAISTGRRPTWSDSDPTVSRAVSTARAYTPNTMVTVMGEKPHAAWYTAYNGVGALEPASRNTTMDTCSAKAALIERWLPRAGASGARSEVRRKVGSVVRDISITSLG